MSKESFQLVIGKAVLDLEFRQALFADPDQALSEFKLSAAEKNSLKKIDSEALELMAKTLEISQPGLKPAQKRQTASLSLPKDSE